MGFVIALGLDKGKTNALRMTRMASPGATTESGGKDDELPMPSSALGSAIYTGLNI